MFSAYGHVIADLCTAASTLSAHISFCRLKHLASLSAFLDSAKALSKQLSDIILAAGVTSVSRSLDFFPDQILGMPQSVA